MGLSLIKVNLGIILMSSWLAWIIIFTVLIEIAHRCYSKFQAEADHSFATLTSDQYEQYLIKRKIVSHFLLPI